MSELVGANRVAVGSAPCEAGADVQRACRSEPCCSRVRALRSGGGPDQLWRRRPRSLSGLSTSRSPTIRSAVDVEMDRAGDLVAEGSQQRRRAIDRHGVHDQAGRLRFGQHAEQPPGDVVGADDRAPGRGHLAAAVRPDGHVRGEQLHQRRPGRHRHTRRGTGRRARPGWRCRPRTGVGAPVRGPGRGGRAAARRTAPGRSSRRFPRGRSRKRRRARRRRVPAASGSPARRASRATPIPPSRPPPTGL